MERQRNPGRQVVGASRRFAMLLFPGFPMMAFSSVVEPLRAANALDADPKYSWITVSATDRPVAASNGITFTPDFRLVDDPPADFIVVCSGGDADQLTPIGCPQLDGQPRIRPRHERGQRRARRREGTGGIG